MLEKGLTALAGVLAVITAVLGLITAQTASAKDQAQSTAQAQGRDLSSLQAENDGLKAQNEQLQSDNETLRAQSGLPGPTAAPSAGTVASVRHAGKISIANNNGVDLDSAASDPQWGSPSTSDDSGDLNLYDGRIRLSFYGYGLSLGTTKADYDTCLNSTGYSNNDLSLANMEPGNYLCVKTGKKRISAVRLVSKSSSSITVDVTTYDPPLTN